MPHATYRFQFNADFTFADARGLVPYLSRLGVTDIYASPLLRARRASNHGYDVTDPTLLNPNIGDEMQFRELTGAAQAHGMGLVLDIVPNHMAASLENPYWEHVLTYGPSSPYAGWFDIDFRQPDPDLWGRVLVPILGERIAEVVENGEIALNWSDGRFRVCYYEHCFPIDPASVPLILRYGRESLKALLSDDEATWSEIRRIARTLNNVPSASQRLHRKHELDIESVETTLSRLAQIIERSPQLHDWVGDVCTGFGSGEDGPARMLKLLKRQSYRLVYWRRAARILNYRRFFNINDLVSIRQEDPEVFDATHRMILRLIDEKLVTGLRIDHIDGLRDPKGYLERLADRADEAAGKGLPIWVEKIVAPHESLPSDWPVAGTSGYEFLNEAEALFVSPSGLDEVTRGYDDFLRRPLRFETVARWGKRRILRHDLSAFVGRLADHLVRIAEDDPSAAAITEREHVSAITEFVVGLPVYRTYVDQSTTELTPADVEVVDHAIAEARESRRCSEAALDFLASVVRLDKFDSLSEQQRNDRLHFIERLQQLTGPAAAKGIEDTALYLYVPLSSLNEVGSEPHLPVDDAVDRLHAANLERASRHPAAMLTVTTHDTKRTADVRARLDVLSERPQFWLRHLNRWHDQNRKRLTRVDERVAPNRTAEYLFYQTLLGVWPDTGSTDEIPAADELAELRERLTEYMIKAVREGKRRTTWATPDEGYENALRSYIASVLDPEESGAFLQEVQRFSQFLIRSGYWNSIARTVLHLTSPGTPDIYQGDELWNFALVDPDNRRPVDYERRGDLLGELVSRFEQDAESRRGLIDELVANPSDGRIKMHTLRALLGTRQRWPALFESSEYRPVMCDGTSADHLFGFVRVSEEAALMTIVPRLTCDLVGEPGAAPAGDAWGDTTVAISEDLRGDGWKNVLTGEAVTLDEATSVRDLLATFPAACLVRDAATT